MHSLGASRRGDNWRRLLGFRCTGCGNCCRETVVLVTDADVRRVTQATGRTAREFVRFFGPDAVEMAQRDPMWITFDTGRAVMALKWSNGHCLFLGADNLCNIYAHRPVTCREHPFNVTLGESGRVEKLGLSRVVECPHDWDGKVSLREVKGVVRWNERQSDAYTEKVRAWNRRRSGVRTRPEFLRYLGLTA